MRDKLELLKELVVDAYIEALRDGEIHFRDMSPIVSLLNTNNIVEEKQKSTVEENIKKRIEEAKARRSEG